MWSLPEENLRVYVVAPFNCFDTLVTKQRLDQCKSSNVNIVNCYEVQSSLDEYIRDSSLKRIDDSIDSFDHLGCWLSNPPRYKLVKMDVFVLSSKGWAGNQLASAKSEVEQLSAEVRIGGNHCQSCLVAMLLGTTIFEHSRISDSKGTGLQGHKKGMCRRSKWWWRMCKCSRVVS